MILITTDKDDTHADAVIECLRKYSVCFFRLNVDVESLRETWLTKDEVGWHLRTGAGVLELDSVSSVWCRKASVHIDSSLRNTEDNGFRIWKGEWNRALFGMYNYLSNVYWLNSIRNATLADNKFYQSIAASNVGLGYPEFLTSNDKEKINEFMRSHDDVVIKFLSQDIFYVDGEINGIYVNKIKLNEIEEFESVGENPITLQRYINKKFEARYTFVGGEHFVCRIDSQLSRIANIDWRRYDLKNTPHQIIAPPEEIKQKVCALMDFLSLDYGALDFVVDRFDNWWFLEVNSTGQWLWIEDLCGLNISNAIAMRLISGGKESLGSRK